jgi:peptidase E
MGSGELTATMVEVHKELLAGLAGPPHAIFLDTPAGFQLNVDHLSERATEYFRQHVQQDMSIVSFKSNETSTPLEAEQAFHAMREANFFLVGPGSPSYAVRQWQETPIPEILTKRVEDGGCLVAASAAALTVGRFTLPVYEIYKVGEELHWLEGMNILEHFGFNFVVIPHWNNAEGGTHDTRFCFMGESRFAKLESLLPEDISIFGLDEHTACLIDLDKNEAVIKGLGTVTLRRRGGEIVFAKGDRFSLDILRGEDLGKDWQPVVREQTVSETVPEIKEESFWDRIHAIETAFRAGLEQDKATQELEHEEFISQAREVLRDLIVLLGMRLAASPKDRTNCLAPLVEDLLKLREKFRQNQQWQEADAIRNSLERAEIIVEDTEEGSSWRLKS